MKEFIKDWIWQLPQNLLGVLYKSYLGDSIINRVNIYDYEKVYLKKTRGGVSLGKYIFMYQDYSNKEWKIQHEKGHTKQSLVLGPLYLIVIGLPSLIHNIIYRLCKKLNIKWNYYKFYTEKWANKLAGIK